MNGKRLNILQNARFGLVFRLGKGSAQMGTRWAMATRSMHGFGTEIAIRASKYVEVRSHTILRGVEKVVGE